jgi:hypothetical protein
MGYLDLDAHWHKAGFIWPQLTIRTHEHTNRRTHWTTTIADHFIEKWSAKNTQLMFAKFSKIANSRKFPRQIAGKFQPFQPQNLIFFPHDFWDFFRDLSRGVLWLVDSSAPHFFYFDTKCLQTKIQLSHVKTWRSDDNMLTSMWLVEISQLSHDAPMIHRTPLNSTQPSSWSVCGGL